VIITAIRHPVQNYDTWKAVYDTMPPTSRGAKFSRVNRSVDDSNMVVVVAGSIRSTRQKPSSAAPSSGRRWARPV